MRIISLILIFFDNPKNTFFTGVSSFVIGYNVHTEAHELVNYYLRETAFVVSIIAGLFTIYTSIKKYKQNGISKRKR